MHGSDQPDAAAPAGRRIIHRRPIAKGRTGHRLQLRPAAVKALQQFQAGKAEKDKAARKARCAEMLQALRLESLAKRYPAQLSGGQQQRTALARILVGKPKILMLDEPFSALDSYLREEVEGEVGSLLAGFDGTALLVTHNRDEAYRLCRDMIVMDGGQVLRTGTTKEVFADPRSTAAARLTGCKNILPCTRVDAHSVRLAGCESLLHLAAEVPELHRRRHPRPRLRPCAPAQRTPCRWSFSRPARTPSTGTSSSSCQTAPLVCGGK